MRHVPVRAGRIVALAAICATSAAGLMTVPAGAASTTAVVKGSLRRVNASGYRVMLLPTRGPASYATVAGDGSFSLTVPAASTGGASLQLLHNGRYAGPVTLRFGASVGYLRLHALRGGATLKLGGISVSDSGGFAALSSGLGIGDVDTTHPVAVDANGRPRGAGVLGLVKMKSKAQGVAAAAIGASANDPCPPNTTVAEDGAGGDCDGDGIPNAIDVDDNGNSTLDMTDPASASTTAQFMPSANLTLSLGNTLNANARPITANDIATTIGGANTFTFNYFLQQFNFVQAFGSGAAPDSVWLDCGSIAWCNATSGTAHIEVAGGGQFADHDWKTYTGEDVGDSSTTPLASPAPFNGFYRTQRPQGYAWNAAVQPRDGASSLTDLVPGQMLGLYVRTGPTTVNVPMALSPYPVTVPALKAVGAGGADASAVDYSSGSPAGSLDNPIVISGDGTLHVDAWRPQRLALPGESGQFRDLGKLHYGIVLAAGGPQIGCSSAPNGGYYSGLSSALTPATAPMNFWPLADSATDGTGAPSPSTFISFTLDVRRCLTDSGVTVPPGGIDVYGSLVAAGEQLGGGATQAVQQFKMHVNPAS